MPSPDLQVAFYSRLQSVRRLYLADALAGALNGIDIRAVDQELAEYVGAEYLKRLAQFGLRGEILFPVPIIISAAPTLLGYYRLLYGFSQKEFYKGKRAGFKRVEDPGIISPHIAPRLPALCRGLILAGKGLLDGIDKFSPQISHDLQLLTLGPQFRGSRNTRLGQAATKTVFDLIKTVLGKYVIAADDKSMTVRNAARREVMVAFSSDPDIQLTEELSSGNVRPIVSIEIKGGTDYSNIHNRIGEAEKSHQKARARGFGEFWTIVGVRMDLRQARVESPTTSRFFQLSRISDPEDDEHLEFRELLVSLTGIRTAAS